MNFIDIPEREVLSFLVKAWSENKKARFRWIKTGGFHAVTRDQYVLIEHIRNPNNVPELSGFNRWRFWRWETFHESMHLKFSSLIGPKEYVDQHCEKRDNAMALPLMKSLEDFRINCIGLQTYIGYFPEHDFKYSLALAHFLAQTYDPILSQQMRQSPRDEWFVEFISRLYFSQRLDWIQAQHEDQTEKFLDVARTVTHQRGIATLIDIIIKWLDREFPNTPFNDPFGMCDQTANQGSGTDQPRNVLIAIISKGGAEQPDTKKGKQAFNRKLKKLAQQIAESRGLSSKEAKKAANQAVKGAKIIKLEFNRLEKAKEDAKNAPDFALSTRSELVTDSHGLPTSETARVVIPKPSEERYPDLIDPVESEINRLKSRLRRWRTGWKEVVDTHGDDLDVEAMVTSRISHKQHPNPRIFLDENKLSSRGKMSILIDMSSSIGSNERAYLRSGAIIAEGLSFINARFEVFCFNSTRFGTRYSGPVLYLIKSVREPWGLEQRERLASMENSGGTPLSNALAVVRKRLKRSSINRLTIITDGHPNDAEASTEQVSTIVRDGTSVFFIGVLSASTENMREMLSNRSNNRVAMLDSLIELPDAFFRMLKTSR